MSLGGEPGRLALCVFPMSGPVYAGNPVTQSLSLVLDILTRDPVSPSNRDTLRLKIDWAPDRGVFFRLGRVLALRASIRSHTDGFTSGFCVNPAKSSGILSTVSTVS